MQSSEEVPICTSFEGDGYTNTVQAFDNAIRDSKNSKNCEELCLPNCEETAYEYTIDTTELNTDDLCGNKDTRKVFKSF
jgi:hypothetical protein